MSDDERYNGYANRETWAVALYINNDQGWQESVFEMLRDADYSSADQWDDPELAARARISIAGDLVKDNVETLLDPDQYADEFGTDQPREVARIGYDIGSLYRVDWYEIGRAFLEDLKDTDE